MTVSHTDSTDAGGRRHQHLRRRGTVAAVAGFALLLGGCGNPVGAAAEVYGSTISESSVTEETAGLIPDGTKVENVVRQSINRQLLTAEIRHQLVVKAAAEQGVTVTDEQVAQASQGATSAQLATELQVGPGRAQQSFKDGLLALAVATKLNKQPVSDVTVSLDLQFSFATKEQAALARQQYLADPVGLAQAIAQATAAGEQTATSQELTMLGANSSAAAFGVFGEPVGSIVVLFQQAEGSSPSWALAKVAKRTVAPSAGLQSGVQNAKTLVERFNFAFLALQPYAKDVTVNPRFGNWDPLALQVIPGSSGL